MKYDVDIKSFMKWFRKALESPEPLNYAKYYELIKEKELATKEQKKIRNTLELFSFGTVCDYVLGLDKYFKLTPAAFEKLRTLTLMSLADECDILELDFLVVQLLARSKREVLNIILNACDYGAITAAVYDDDNYVQFFSVRQRNNDQLNVHRLINIKDTEIENRSVLLILPNCEFTQIVENFLDTADDGSKKFSLAKADLLEFIENNDMKEITYDSENMLPIIEESILNNIFEGLNDLQNEQDKERAYDADVEYEDSEKECHNKHEKKSIKKKKKKAKKIDFNYHS